MRFGGKFLTVLVASIALLAAACGSDDGTASDSDGGEEAPAAAATQNACPSDGCTIDFASITPSGDELEITWEINFDPDINNNHIHIYWDLYDAAQVSNDAAENDLTQGEWVPTDTAPTYVTDGAVSTSVRGESTTLCLVAADRDHNVIDTGAEVCRDVSEFL